MLDGAADDYETAVCVTCLISLLCSRDCQTFRWIKKQEFLGRVTDMYGIYVAAVARSKCKP